MLIFVLYRQLKQQQEAERLAREAKKKAEEEAAKREKEKKLELERQKREQERLRREEEKRQKEEERLKREEEKKRRAKEEKAEKERKRKENEEKQRIEQEKARAIKEEKERIEKERLRLEKERLEKERLEKERLEKERLEKERLEKERLEQQRIEQQRIEKERLEKERSLEHQHPLVNNTTPPPGITAPVANSPEARQQVLIDALVGSNRPIGPPPPHLPSFMSPPNDPMMGIFRPLEPSTSTRRSITSIAPIGQPVTGRRPSTAVQDTNIDPLLTASNMIKGGNEPNSFFSNFLFGKPMYQPWSNGWTENVHGKLFGDALVSLLITSDSMILTIFKPDRTTMTLERAKAAYQKLNEIIGASGFHTLVQLHLMMNDLFVDYPVDIRELYETLSNAPLSGFQCLNHAQHGMIVLLR